MNGKKSRSFVVFSLALVGFPLEAADINEESSPQESSPMQQTIIEGAQPEKPDSRYTYFKDKSSDQMPGDAAMLFHIPGLTLTESGGPLSPSQIRYRGLSGARFRVELEGLLLNNPLNCLSDANSMFLFAAKNLQTNAQSLAITLPAVEYAQAKGVFGFGSQNSLKVGGTAGTPLDPHSSILIATQGYSTNGRFSFQSPDLKLDDPSNNFVRENNDQHRLQGLAKYQRKTDSSSAHTLIAFNAHEGGIPGFAFSPTKNLRSQTIFAGLKMGGSKKIRDAEFGIDLANNLFDYRSFDKDADEQFLSSTHELTFKFATLKLPEWLDFDFSNQVILERAYELNQTRVGMGFLMNRNMRFKGSLKPTFFVKFNMLAFHQEGLLFKKDFSFSIEPTDYLSLTGRFLRHQRLPTFMEMYASNRFFVGNPNLTREGLWDLELSSNLRLGRHFAAQLTGFFGYLSDVIVYVPLDNVKLNPVNVKTAQRFGLDLALVIEPLPWLLVESKNSLLKTKNQATDAPLPEAPAFMGLSKIRFGMEDVVALSLQSRYRGTAYGTIYGTLPSKPYILFDAVLSAKTLEFLNLSLSVTNIFNIKTARDTYETPLPGTVFFGQIEVGNV
jgi:hypothetical protein